MSPEQSFRRRRPALRSHGRQTRLFVERLEPRNLLAASIFEVEPNNSMSAANLLPLGFDASEETALTVKGDIASLGDRDWFQVQLNAGDVIGAGVNGQSGLDPAMRFVNAAGRLLMSNDNHFFAGISLPSKSPVRFVPPSLTDSIFHYVINTPGTYFIEVAASSDASTGKYAMDVVVARPELESQPVGTKQILFVDFDGAKVNTSKFGFSGTATLSPLASFLPAWGLTAADENAVIDAILATISENLSQDVRSFGLNGDFAATHTPGDFDIEIRNSRDHLDEFGENPFVSRLVIGGTFDEFGLDERIVGIAEDIDPGNFKTDDEGVVLLDRLSGPTSDPFSLNRIEIRRPHTKIELIGIVVGRVATHEAGHFFGNWHTDLVSGVPNMMDQGGRLQSLGPDGVFGTHDDFDEDFGVDIFSTAEVFAGVEDTLNVIAYGLSTGKGTGTANATAGVAADASSSPGGAGALSAMMLTPLADADDVAGLLPTASRDLPTAPAKTAATTPRTALLPALEVAFVDPLFAAIDVDEQNLIAVSPDEDEEVNLTDAWLLDWGFESLSEG